MIRKSITIIVKDALEEYVSEGNIAVDLTAGNGNDTCFLADKVGISGKVYAFDVQAVAIENTKKQLATQDLLNRVVLIHDGHENLNTYVHESIDIAMANLGYLPSGDKQIITKPESTIKALELVLEKLKVGGIMSIVVYYGHEGGVVEKDAVGHYIGNLDEKYFDVLSLSYPNRKKDAPIIYFIHKRKSL